jgi:hypothetical protein
MRKRQKSPTDSEKYCFIISPIGEKGSEKYNKFKEVYDYIIKPAIKNSGYDVRVIRADDIDRPGSFIKDILENLLNSFVVIADLSEQSPNVFYELGVRHSLSPRTILIARSVDDIPSDLREYRTITYENSAKGVKDFSDRLKNYFQEIFREPERPDSPVLDRLGSILENRTHQLQNQVSDLKEQLDRILRKGPSKETISKEERVNVRMDRLLKLKNATNQLYQLDGGEVIFGEGEKEKKIYLTVEEGDFDLYFLISKNEIEEYWYVSIVGGNLHLEKELADIRVLLNDCLDKNDIKFKFIIATNEDLSTKKDEAQKAFSRILDFIPKKHRNRFILEIWDKDGLLEQEKSLGLKVDV